MDLTSDKNEFSENKCGFEPAIDDSQTNMSSHEAGIKRLSSDTTVKSCNPAFQNEPKYDQTLAAKAKSGDLSFARNTCIGCKNLNIYYNPLGVTDKASLEPAHIKQKTKIYNQKRTISKVFSKASLLDTVGKKPNISDPVTEAVGEKYRILESNSNASKAGVIRYNRDSVDFTDDQLPLSIMASIASDLFENGKKLESECSNIRYSSNSDLMVQRGSVLSKEKRDYYLLSNSAGPKTPNSILGIENTSRSNFGLQEIKEAELLGGFRRDETREIVSTTDTSNQILYSISSETWVQTKKILKNSNITEIYKKETFVEPLHGNTETMYSESSHLSKSESSITLDKTLEAVSAIPEPLVVAPSSKHDRSTGFKTNGSNSGIDNHISTIPKTGGNNKVIAKYAPILAKIHSAELLSLYNELKHKLLRFMAEQRIKKRSTIKDSIKFILGNDCSLGSESAVAKRKKKKETPHDLGLETLNGLLDDNINPACNFFCRFSDICLFHYSMAGEIDRIEHFLPPPNLDSVLATIYNYSDLYISVRDFAELYLNSELVDVNWKKYYSFKPRVTTKMLIFDLRENLYKLRQFILCSNRAIGPREDQNMDLDKFGSIFKPLILAQGENRIAPPSYTKAMGYTVVYYDACNNIHSIRLVQVLKLLYPDLDLKYLYGGLRNFAHQFPVFVS